VASDFSQIWFGASALLKGMNPYPLVGPGRMFESDFELLYPLTASVAVLPLGLLSEQAATIVFVFVSSGILAYAVTRDGWYRAPMFLSGAFFMAARRGQWSLLLTAAYCLPAVAWVLVAKPNIGIAILSSVSSARMLKVALGGGLVLLVVALALQPTWISDWLSALGAGAHTAAPVTARGGFLVLLGLLRWRRPEARLLVALACVPHSIYWYDILPLMLIPANFREMVMFVLVTTTGLAFEQVLIARETDLITLYRDFNALVIAVAYLPATMLVLSRPNAGSIQGPAIFRRREAA
jgi:hypothetical protein